jgi:hypothetical protein
MEIFMLSSATPVGLFYFDSELNFEKEDVNFIPEENLNENKNEPSFQKGLENIDLQYFSASLPSQENKIFLIQNEERVSIKQEPENIQTFPLSSEKKVDFFVKKENYYKNDFFNKEFSDEKDIDEFNIKNNPNLKKIEQKDDKKTKEEKFVFNDQLFNIEDIFFSSKEVLTNNELNKNQKFFKKDNFLFSDLKYENKELKIKDYFEDIKVYFSDKKEDFFIENKEVIYDNKKPSPEIKIKKDISKEFFDYTGSFFEEKLGLDKRIFNNKFYQENDLNRDKFINNEENFLKEMKKISSENQNSDIYDHSFFKDFNSKKVSFESTKTNDFFEKENKYYNKYKGSENYLLNKLDDKTKIKEKFFDQNSFIKKEELKETKDSKEVLFYPAIGKEISSSEISSSNFMDQKDFSQKSFVSSIVKKAVNISSQLAAKGGGVAKIQIQDDKIGSLELHIFMEKENKVSMEIKTSNSEFKNVIETNYENLKKSLDSQNIFLSDFKVTSLEKIMNSNFLSGGSDNFNQNFSQSLFLNYFNNSNSFLNQNKNERIYSEYDQENIPERKFVIKNDFKKSKKNIQRGANGSIKVLA